MATVNTTPADLGAVTGYAIARERGYTGTLQQWVDAQLDSATALERKILVSDTAPSTSDTQIWIDTSDTSTVYIPQIKDDLVTDTDTWSSEKINSELSELSTDLKSALGEGIFVNGIDNIASLPTRVDSGVTFATSGRNYIISSSGPATASTFVNLFVSTSSMPEWCQAGKTYWFGMRGDISNLEFDVYLYKGEQYAVYDMLKTEQPFRIPDDITGLLLRIRVVSGQTYANQIVYPYITEQTPYWVIGNKNVEYYVGSTRTGTNTFKTLKSVTEYITANNIVGATVHVDGEVFDLATEYASDFSGMTADDATNVYYGPEFGNSTKYIFHGSKVIFNYSGNNNSVKAHFSPINIIGDCTIDSLELECSNCRYAVHDDKGAANVTSPLIVEYRHCKIGHKGSDYINTNYWLPVAVGAGVRNGDIRIVDDCYLTVNTDQTTWCYAIHNDSYDGYAKVAISNTYGNGQLRLRNVSSSTSAPGYISVLYIASRFELGVINNDDSVIALTKYNEAEKVEDNLKPRFYLADGDMDTFVASDNADDGHVAYHTDSIVPAYNEPYSGKILAMNHDDLAPSDYLGTWKIYNKYGYRANFNIIVKPFSTKAEKEQKIAAVKEMAESGNEFGLHAILEQSYWTMNKTYDLRPDLGRTFAPSLSELSTAVSGTNNVFGVNVSSTVSSCGLFADPPSSIASVVLSALTSGDWHTLFNQYTLLTSETRYTGLDLNDAQQSYTALQWIEYWYNNLVDSSLGNTGYNYGRAFFNECYDIGVDTSSMTEAERRTAQESYYPTASEIVSGRYVFYDDVDNPNYSTYHKVGRFTKGLFKGCATTCNFEVIDRIIEAAKAFCRHYFGIEKFTNYSRHGTRFSMAQWTNNGFYYDDRNFTIMGGDYGRFYSLRHGQKESERDIFLRGGITNLGHPPVGGPLPTVYGQIGLYYGQHGVRMPYFGGIERFRTGYLAFFGTSGAEGNENMDAETYRSYTKDIKNLLKFAYENAGGTISNGESTKAVYPTIRNMLDNIRATFGTGKIPFFSFDTIRLNAADMAAVHMLAEYCYKNDIKIVPVETARRIAETTKRTAHNLFGNPGFSQSILNMFGGTSTSGNAYLPDGWYADAALNVGEVSVSASDSIRKMAFNPSGEHIALSQIQYGLDAGNYRISISGYGEGSMTVYLARNKNKPVPLSGMETVGTITFTANDSEHHLDFTIPEFYSVPVDGSSDEETITGGYANNVCAVFIRLFATSALTVYEPKLERI